VTVDASPARSAVPWPALVAVAAGAVAALALRLARGFPWSLALIAGLAVGVFTLMLLRTTRVLRAVWSPPAEGPERERPGDD
jgi:hypothetical protein